MSIKVNADDFLIREAVDKFLEVMVCTGRYDVGEVDSDEQAFALADKILADARLLLAAAIRRDADILATESAAAMADLE